MPFLFDQPETFYTINFIPGIKYGKYDAIFLLGTILIILSVLIFLIFRKNKTKMNNYLIIFFFIFWMPLYANLFYNNVYDFKENIDLLNSSDREKRQERLCNMEKRQTGGGYYCNLFKYLEFIKNKLPANSEYDLVVFQGSEVYFNYYLFPDFKYNKNSYYILFYYPNKYIYQDNKLYRIENGKKIEIGNYKVFAQLDYGQYILK